MNVNLHYNRKSGTKVLISNSTEHSKFDMIFDLRVLLHFIVGLKKKMQNCFVVLMTSRQL